jgi:hypothetical protein
MPERLNGKTPVWMYACVDVSEPYAKKHEVIFQNFRVGDNFVSFPHGYI